MSYPCAMLNVTVAENNTNDQFAVGGACGRLLAWQRSGRLWCLGRQGPSSPPLLCPLPSCPDLFMPPHVQTLVDSERRQYEVSSEMSIEFEVDGPYKVWEGVAFREGVAFWGGNRGVAFQMELEGVRRCRHHANLGAWPPCAPRRRRP